MIDNKKQSAKIVDWLKGCRTMAATGQNNIPIATGTPFEKYLSLKNRDYLVVTGATKAGKTQLLSFFTLFNPIWYAFHHRDYKIHWLYLLLEETAEDVYCRFVSFILYRKYGVRCDYDTLTSASKDTRIPSYVLEIIESKEFCSLLDFFHESISFVDHATTSETVRNCIITYFKQYGIVNDKTIKFIGSDGGEHTRLKLSYSANDKSLKHIIILDNFNNLQPMRTEYSITNAIMACSRNLVYLKNIFNCVVVGAIQQLDEETNSLRAYNAGNILATKTGIKDCKQVGNDCTQLWGISDPSSFSMLKNYEGYDMDGFHRNYFRVVENILKRKGKGKAEREFVSFHEAFL
jgi:hypothetical protein